MNRNVFHELIIAEAWQIVCDELVIVLREGGMTATAADFMDGTAGQ
jgi:hypothetical protein